VSSDGRGRGSGSGSGAARTALPFSMIQSRPVMPQSATPAST